MKRLLPLTLTAFAFLTVAAVADLSVKDGGGTTRVIKNFVCETTKLCNSTVLIKSDGTEIGTSSAEVFVGGRGTAGSAAGGVLTVQGSASGTAVPVSITSVPSHEVTNAGTFATQAAVTAASGSYASGAFSSGSMVDLLTLVGTKNAGTGAASSLLAGGIYNSTPLTLTNTQQSSLQLDANGYLKVNTAAGAAAGGTSSAFAAAFPANGTAAGMSQGGNMVAMTGTSGNLNVQCANCSGSGVSTVDAAAFTASTSLFAGTGGFFQTTATNNALTNGQQGMWQMTANRAGFVNLRDTAGTAIGTSAAEVFVGGRGTAGSAAGGVLTVQGSASGTAIPVSLATVPSHAVTNAGTFATQAAVTAASGSFASGAFSSGSMVDLGAISDAAVTAGATGSVSAKLRSISRDVMTTNTWAGGTLGAMANYGTSPGAVLVPGVNAFVTNTQPPGQAVMASSSPVVIASNQSAIPVTMTSTTITGTVAATQSGTWTVQPGNTANTTAWLVRPNDGTRSAIVDPCEATLQSYAPISITTATTTRIVAPSASNKTYICHLFLTSAAADNVGIVEGTGGTCGSGTAGVIGGTTAANGPNFAANGGVALHAGGKVAVAQTAGTNVDLCLITSAATPLAGGIKYVQAP